MIIVLLATEQTGAFEKALSKTTPLLANFSIAGIDTPSSLYNFIYCVELSSVVSHIMLGCSLQFWENINIQKKIDKSVNTYLIKLK